MQIEFLNQLGGNGPQSTLESLLEGAARVDAAVAGLSQAGVGIVRRFVVEHPSAELRLVVSVGEPTDLRSVARLAEMLEGRVFIDTAIDAGHERGLRARTALFEYPDRSCSVLTGSFDWTESVLSGTGVDAGVLVHTHVGEPLVEDVRAFVAQCMARSEPFDAKRLRLYQTLQQSASGGRSTRTFPDSNRHGA